VMKEAFRFRRCRKASLNRAQNFISYGARKNVLFLLPDTILKALFMLIG
jgi:hypothetical protein